MSMSCCMCEPMETAQSFLAMTHMWWSQSQSGREGTGCTLSVVPYVGGLRAWPFDKCSNKVAVRSERKSRRIQPHSESVLDP